MEADYQVLFTDVSLEKPDKIDKNAILRNMASYFPSPEQRFVVIDAFHGLYVNILDELTRFLGAGLTKETIHRLERIGSDIEAFSVDSNYKKRLSGILKEIVQKYGN